MAKSKQMGRPSKYCEKYATKLLEIMSNGSSKMEAAAKLKISRDTMYRWAKEHEEFGEAFKTGAEWSEAKNAEIIKLIALGQVPKANVAAYQMYMRNTAGWDKYQGEGSVNQTINIQQMNVLKDKSTHELLEYIQNTSEELRDVIDITEYE